MTTITLPRAVVEQALEALELGYDSAKSEADQYHAAMAGFRPERHAQMDADVQQIAKAITALRAALAQEPTPPPEARTEAEKTAYAAGWWDALRKAQQAEPVQELPQRKPLTDEEIRDLWSWSMTAEAERTATTQQHAFTRAIERAHGIGGQE